MIRPRSNRNFFSGLLFCVVGSGFAWGATAYNIGESSRMGPGYFPLMIGVLLAVLGAGAMLTSFAAGGAGGDPVGAWAWKPLTLIIGANVVFGILLGGLPSLGVPAMGMIAGIYALVFIASRAGGKRPFKEVFILASVLAAGSYATFVLGLKLQFPVWPSFITG